MKTVNSFADMSDATLKCRAWTHQWDGFVSPEKRVGRRIVHEEYVWCERCDLTRYRLLDKNFKVIPGSARYGYERCKSDYLVKNIKRWGGRSELRRNVYNELSKRAPKVVTQRRHLRAVK